MKTNLIHSQYNNKTGSMPLYKYKSTLAHKKEKINTREDLELNRPARAISFGGSANLNKFVKKAFNSTVELVNDNEAAYNAIYALIVAGILKPIFVLNMPGSEEKDKQIVATKNFLQAFLGSFLSLTIGGGFIKKAIDIFKTNKDLIEIDDKNNVKAISATSEKALETAKNILKKEGKKPTIDEIVEKAKQIIKNLEANHLKAFQKNPKFLKELKLKEASAGYKTSLDDACEVLWKNSTGALTAIGKAKISSLLLPGVMAFLFAKKNAQKEAMQKARQNILTNNSSFKNEQEQYKKMMNKDNPSISFKGNILTSAIDGAATLIEKAAMSKFGEDATKLLAHAQKPSARMSDIESVAITAYWLQNTARSKKIEPSQKLGLNVHSTLVTIVSSTAAFIIDWALDPLIDKSKDKYKQKLEEIAKSVKTMKTGESLNEILKDLTPAEKMGIKDEIIRVLDSKAQITDEDIKTIINNLKKMKTFEGFNFDENIIKKAVQSLQASEPIRKEIAKQCADMIGAKDIAKNLARSINDNKALEDTISKLSKKYAKKLSKFKSLTIFTLVVRFLVPVLMVPFSGKLKKKIVEWTSSKQAAESKIKN